MLQSRRRVITPEMRSSLQSQLESRFNSGKVKRTGISAKLLRGEDVQKHVDTVTKEQETAFEKKADELLKKLEENMTKRTDAVLKYLQGVVFETLKQIKQPENGHTPTPEEIAEVAAPLITQAMGALLKQKTEEDKDPSELESAFEEKVAAVGKKKGWGSGAGGGAGPEYFYELADTPQKVGKLRAPYSGYENRFLRVSPDGTRLIWTSSSGTGISVKTEVVTAVQAGADVTIDLTQLSEYATFENLILAMRNQIPQTEGVTFTFADPVITIPDADASEVFAVTYAYS